MEDLTEAMATSFQVTQFPNNPHAPHPRFSQYKIKHKNSDQQTRRERILEEQKRQRDKFVNAKRNINGGDTEEEEEEEKPMQWQQTKTKTKTKKKIQRDRLMLSEWLVEVPVDLAENWYFMLCPIGRRCLVLTNRGQTSAYSRSGYFMRRFSSHLPGGSKRDQKGGKEYTSLDCVFSEINRTFYVLDVMCWKGHPVYDSETEFRFYWLNDKLSEIPEISQITSMNQFRFVPLQYFKYSRSEMHRVMCTRHAQFEVDLDGILFYHKATHYTVGATPLVNWLKAYMIPEVLDVEVMAEYMAARPADFEGITHLKEKKSKSEKMDL